MISGLLPALGDLAEEETAAGRFSGTVLVARGDELIFAGAYGLADRERGTPVTLDTRFTLGSMTTMFTGVATGQLVQAGHVDPAAPVRRYLTDYPHPEVTVHHLLTHAGGTGEVFLPDFPEHKERLREIPDYVSHFAGRELRFVPGTHHEYSNFGYILLGAVIEKITGNYYDYVDEHVFAPAGMTRTGMLPDVPDVAVGYTSCGGGPPHPNTEYLPYRGTPAAFGYSTVADLWRFALALTGHRLLDEPHTALVTTGQGTVGWAGRCAAYGFFQNMICGRWTTFGQHGRAPGMNGDLGVFPETGHLLAILANMDPPVADDVSNFICGLLPLIPE